MEGDWIWSGEYTIQYTDDVLQNCIPETYIILLINVTLINSIKKENKIKIDKGQLNIDIFSLEKKTTKVYNSRKWKLNPKGRNKIQKTIVRILTFFRQV